MACEVVAETKSMHPRALDPILDQIMTTGVVPAIDSALIGVQTLVALGFIYLPRSAGRGGLSRPLVIAVACWVGAPSPGPARSRLQIRATTRRVEIDRVRAMDPSPGSKG